MEINSMTESISRLVPRPFWTSKVSYATVYQIKIKPSHIYWYSFQQCLTKSPGRNDLSLALKKQSF